MTASNLHSTTDAIQDEENLLSMLSDPDCRSILVATSESPVDASELEEITDIPRSTVYRKIEELAETPLLEEFHELDPGGRHSRKFLCQVSEICIRFAQRDRLLIGID